MKTLKTILEFGQYALDELDETGRLLVQRAIEATAHSYAPYSDFHVGATTGRPSSVPTRRTLLFP